MSTTLDLKDYQFIQENGMMIESSMIFVKGLKIIHLFLRKQKCEELGTLQPQMS